MSDPPQERHPGVPIGLWLAFLVVGMAVLGLARGYFPVGAFNDDASYASQAYRFSSGGSLRIELHPERPLDPYLPGSSLLLTPFAPIFPDPSDLRWVTTFFMAAGALLFGLAAARGLKSGTGGGLIAALCLWNPVTLTHGSTLLAEPAFTLLVGLSAGLVSLRGNRPFSSAGEYGLGFLLGFLPVVRTEGLLVTALLLGLLWHVRGKVPWRVAAVSTLPLLCYRGLAWATRGAMEHQFHYGQLRDYFGGRGLAEVVGQALIAQPAVVGSFLGLTGIVGKLAGGLLIAVALLGLWRARAVPVAAAWVLLPLLAAQLVWPYPDPRYGITLWPALLIACAGLLSERSRLVFLALLLLLTTPACLKALAVSAERASLDEVRWSSYRWLADNTGPEEVLMTLFDARLRLRTGRPVVAPSADSLQFADLLARACRLRVRYFLWEPGLSLRTDLFGQAQAALLPRPDLWMDASTLTQVVQKSDWDRVYRLEVDPGTYLRAYAHYREALVSSEPEQDLIAALRLVDDFPEARVALARHWLDSEDTWEKGLQLLTFVHQQYAIDFEASALLGAELLKRARASQAGDIYLQAQERAEALGFPEQARRFEQLRARAGL